MRDHDDFELRAERDSHYRAYRPERPRRLVLDIALGIWLGGMALTLTWAALWFGLGALFLAGLNLQLG